MTTGAIVRPFIELDRVDKAREIYRLARLGLTCGEIGNRVGFPAATILKIAREEGISVLTSRRVSKIKDQDAVGFGEDVWDRPPHSLRLMHYKRMIAAAKERRAELGDSRERQTEKPAPVTAAEPAKVVSVPYGAPFNFLSPPSAKTIIAYVALRTGVSATDIVGPRRTRVIVAARRVAIQLVHDHCPHLTFAGIGRVFRRDHTTILWSLGRLTHEGKSIEKPTFSRYFTQPTDNRLTA